MSKLIYKVCVTVKEVLPDGRVVLEMMALVDGKVHIPAELLTVELGETVAATQELEQ